ncbi:MAG: hypothetical protein N2053_12945 [Chitinispirillaceae bacterium]|nr:hypothetical protein [Chitinispirillaceae bacterium]
MNTFKKLSIIYLFLVLIVLSCARPEQRARRYDPEECPICAKITAGKCSYCYGSGKCMYCKGNKKRLTVSPNIMDENIKPFSYKTECPFCKGSGVCQYCKASGKCWACNGTAKCKGKWECLVNRENNDSIAKEAR